MLYNPNNRYKVENKIKEPIERVVKEYREFEQLGLLQSKEQTELALDFVQQDNTRRGNFKS